MLGRAFFSQNVLVYLTFIILPVGLHFLMFKTRHGLNMRAVGENPAAADAAGISVHAMRFWYVSAGAALAAGAGAFLTLAFVPSWSEGVVAGRGWDRGVAGDLRRLPPADRGGGGAAVRIITSVGFVGQARGWPVPPALLSMLPYLGTVGFIILPVLAWRRMRRWMAAPAALAEPYRREIR